MHCEEAFNQYDKSYQLLYSTQKIYTKHSVWKSFVICGNNAFFETHENLFDDKHS